MLTKCPDCGTTFRVFPAQLKARAGKVRCGRCGFVFNALETLADDPAPAPAAVEPEHDAIDLPAAESADLELPAPVEQTITATEVAEIAASAPGGDAAIAPEEDYLESPAVEPHGTASRRWPWVLGSFFAVLGLVLQAAYYYRVELAVLRPELGPLLKAACERLGCEVPRPRHIETLGIETSDLRPDPSQPGHLLLTATLRSKAPFAQEWPLLELTLTDATDRKLAVRNFPAGEFLPAGKARDRMIAAGFPANGEIAIALPLDVGDLPAAGYRLYIFYP